MNRQLTDTTDARFRRELDSFFAVTLLNVVFAVPAVGLGIAYVVASVLGTTDAPSSWLRVLAGALALVSFGLGLAWLRSSSHVLRGILLVRRPFRRRRGPPSEEDVTRGIVGMVAHYRENRMIIRRMILVCTVGGFFFLAMGIVSAVEFASFSLAGGSVTVNGFAVLPFALLALGIALVSLLSSYYFTRFSRSWDLRLAGTVRAEERLNRAMEMETE